MIKKSLCAIISPHQEKEQIQIYKYDTAKGFFDYSHNIACTTVASILKLNIPFKIIYIISESETTVMSSGIV